jgi:hypothetical protein
MCGKALPFRNALIPFPEAASMSIQRRSLIKIDFTAGKAKPFRTSGGKAAHVYVSFDQRSRNHRQ